MSAGCEGRYWASGLPCQALAQWHVRVGSREVDAMRACPRHLSAVCVTMLGAEGRRGAALTVRSLPLPERAVREVEGP